MYQLVPAVVPRHTQPKFVAESPDHAWTVAVTS